MLPPLAAAEPTPLKTISLKVTLSFETELSAKPASSTHRASAVRTLSSTCYSPLLSPSPGIINEHTVDPALFFTSPPPPTEVGPHVMPTRPTTTTTTRTQNAMLRPLLSQQPSDNRAHGATCWKGNLFSSSLFVCRHYQLP